MTVVVSFVATVYVLPGFAFTGLGADLRIYHSAPSGLEETCIVPTSYQAEGLASVSPEEDRKEEIKLCRMTVYPNSAETMRVEVLNGQALSKEPKAKEMIGCAKLNSTNPGTNFIEVPKGWTHEQATQAFCRPTSQVDRQYRDLLDMEAKFESTISCSSTAAALSGYHVSRLLGGAGRVPVVVARTFDRKAHDLVIAEAGRWLGSSSSLIAQNWRTFKSASARAASGQPNAKLYTSDGRFVYGGLQENLKGEERYTEVSGAGSYDTRYQRFLGQAAFVRTANAASVEAITLDGGRASGRRTFAEMAPLITQMQDVSDMVLFDVLLSQDDRIGNIHVKPMVMELSGSQEALVPRAMTKDEKVQIEAVQAQMRSYPLTAKAAAEASRRVFPDGRAIFVRAMYLKDNDCAMDVDIRGNMMRSHQVLEKIRHMNPETYKRFMRFAEEVESDRFKSFALNTLLLRPKDYEGAHTSLKGNVQYAVRVLREACVRGDLKLDLVQSYDAQGNWVAPPSTACY
jgi:hypothetical protein